MKYVEKQGIKVRTVSMRIRGLKEDGSQVEGLVPKLESQFKDLGLSLKKNDNTFKSTYQIFKDLSEVWSDLPDFKKAKLLEDIGSKRNAQVVAAIIKNMETATKVANSFEESQGSALVEHEQYMKGVEAAYNKLRNTLTELNMKLLKSDTLVKGLNFANTLLENVAALGKLNIGFTALTGALGFFVLQNKKAIVSMETFNIVSEVGGIKTLASNIVTAGRALLGFKTSAEGATISTTALNTAMGGLLLGIPLLIQGIGALANHQKRVKAEFEETFNELKKQKEVNKDANNLIGTLEKLSEQSKLTAKEEQKLVATKQQLKQLLPKSTELIDEENMSLKEQIGILKDLNKEKLEDAKFKAQDILIEFGDDEEKIKQKIENYKRLKKFHADTVKEYMQKEKEQGYLTTSEKKALEGASKERKHYQELLDEENATLTKIITSKELLMEVDKQETISTLKNQLAHAKNKEEIDEIEEKAKEYDLTLDDLTNKTNDNTDSTKQNTDSKEDNANVTQQQLTSMKDLSSSIESANSNYKMLSDAEKELNENGKLSAETMLELADTYDTFDEIQDYTKEGILEFIQAQKDNETATVESEKNKTKAVIEETKKRMKAYQAELDAISANVGLQMETMQPEDIGSPEYKMYLAKTEGIRKQLKIAFGEMKEAEGRLKFLDALGSSFNPSSSSKPKSSTKSDIQEIDNAYIKLKATLSQLKDEAQDYNTELDNSNTTEVRKIEILNQLNNNLQKQKNTMSELVKAMSSDLSDLQNKLKQILGDSVQFDTYGQIIKVPNKLKSANADLVKSYQDLYSQLEDVKNKQDELTNSQDENIKTIKQLGEEQLELIKTQRKERAEKAQETLDIVSEVESQIVEILRHNLEKKKSLLEEEYREDLDRLEKRHDKHIQSYDDELKEYEKFINAKLDKAEEENAKQDYLDGVAERTKEINELQLKINELSLVDTREANVKKAELEKQLTKEKEDLNKYQVDRNRQMEEDALHDALQDKRNQINELKQAENDRYNHKKNILEREYQEEKEYLDKQLENKRLYKKAQKMMEEESYSNLMDMFEEFHKSQGEGWSLLGETIENEYLEKLRRAKDALEEIEELEEEANYGSRSKGRKYDTGKGTNISDDDARSLHGRLATDSSFRNSERRRAERVIRDREELGLDTSAQEKYLDKINSYHVGGFVGGKPLDPKHEEIAKMLKGEFVLTPDKLDSVPKHLNNFVSKLIPKIQFPKIQTANSGGYGDISTNVYVTGNVDKSVMPNFRNMLNKNNRKVASMLKQGDTRLR